MLVETVTLNRSHEGANRDAESFIEVVRLRVNRRVEIVLVEMDKYR